jgi:hypothetical protein
MGQKRFFATLLVLTCICGIYGFIAIDDEPLLKIKHQLDKWVNDEPVEKVYLQMDKPYYAAGDDIWFKAYVVEGSSHQFSTLSGIVNVELVDARDSVKQSVKLPLILGTTHGDFALPDTLRAGNYHIRAYTNYMRNAGNDYFFSQPLTILNAINPRKDNDKIVSNTKGSKIDVQFFPEGGYLVNGIPTKVAFKAIAPDGLGADVKGTVTDNKGRQVAQLTSTHLGMGVFEMTPLSGETYSAKITDANGSESTIALPKASNDGYVLNIKDNDSRNLAVKISEAPSSFKNNPNRQVTLIAQSGGKIYYTLKNKPGNAVFNATIPKNALPGGIVQFTLFSTLGEPLNERLVFIENTHQLNLAVTADQKIYQPRQKVKLILDAQSYLNKPANGSFSVSVIDETKVPVDQDAENNIMASLLLTSDIRGYVEQPAWYFNHTDEKSHPALNALMLTQGYHRFEWKQILNNSFKAQQHRVENDLRVSGTVLTTGGKPVVNGSVKLYDLDSIAYTRDAVTDEHGRFVFKNLTFDDSVRFIIQARTAKNRKDVDIKMDKIVPVAAAGNAPGFDVRVNSGLTLYAENSKLLYNAQRDAGLGNHVITLQEVIVREKKDLLKYSSNLNGPGNADQVIRGSELARLGCPNITNCLQGRLLGVNFHNGIAYSTRDQRPMQVVVDGVYVEGSYLNNLNYFDIQGIEVLRNIGLTAIYGSHGGSGLLLITTKRGGDSEDYPAPIFGRGITTYYPKGFYKAREFYSPRYTAKTNKELADLRTTIYWQPNLLTGSDGKAAFEYFNAGSTGTYRVVIEGIGADGSIGRQVYRYRVE